MFDEGPAMKLGTGHLPPAYPLTQIKTPLVLFEGTSDSLHDVSLKHLPSLVGRHCVQGYEHLDFIWAADVGEQVWPQIIKYLNQLRCVKSSCEPISPPPEISKMSKMSRKVLIEVFNEYLKKSDGFNEMEREKDLEFY